MERRTRVAPSRIVRLATLMGSLVPVFVFAPCGSAQAVPDTPEPAHPLVATCILPRPDTPPLRTYETATVVARSVESASSAVTVLDAAELDGAGPQTAGDVLEAVPGLSLLKSGGRAGVTNAFVRGGDSNFTLVLLDGMPLNDATDLTGGSVNLEELSTDFVERVEIVRGPLTSFYGPGSLSGAIQLFTQRGARGPYRADVGADVGNANLLHGFARASGTRGTAGYSAGAAWSQESQRVGDDKFKGLELWATSDVTLSSTTRLGFTGRFAGADASDYPDSSGGPVYGSGLLRESERRDGTVSARLERGQPGGRRHERLTIGVARRGLERASPAVPPQVPASSEDTTFTRLRSAYELSLALGTRTTLDGGLSGEGEWGSNESVLHLPAFLGGDTPGDYHETRATGGAYLGLRHQRGPVLFEAALRADAATGAALQVNPHAGILWRIGPQGTTRLRASAGRASKLPSFFALASPRALGGNPDLLPEDTLGGEIGLDHTFGHLEAGATFFRQEYRDLVDFDYELFQLVNRAQVSARGTEFVLRWRALASLSLEGQATWLDAHEVSGAPLLHRPRWCAAARVSWQPAPRVALRIESRGASSSLDRELAVPERDEVDGYGLVALAGSWKLRDRWMLRARLDNATDRSYETMIGFPGPGPSFSVGLVWSR